jgi:peptidoglycan/LPS O-acetylase OafA/YrhL
MTLIYLDQLMYGSVCALLLTKHPKAAELFRSKWWFWCGLTTNLAIAKLIEFHTYDAKWYFLTSIASLICAIAILHHASDKTALKDGFVAWIGRISFSIYLSHGLVIDYLNTGEILPSADTPFALLVVILISFVTERYIERPGIRLSKMAAPFKARPRCNFG